MAFFVPFECVRGGGSIIATSAPANRQVQPLQTPVFDGFTANGRDDDGY